MQVYVKQLTHIIGFYERHAWIKHLSWPQKIFLYLKFKFVFFWVGKILCYIYIYIYMTEDIRNYVDRDENGYI